MPPLLVDAYSTSAEKLALNAFRAGDINGLIPCKPAGPNDVKRRDQFVRPCGTTSLSAMPLLSVLRQARAASSSRAHAWIVEATLKSPDFLFHTLVLAAA